MENILKLIKKTGFLVVFFSCFLGACHHSDPVVPECDRTILVYLAVDNSLDAYARKNISSMLQGMEQANGRVVIYMDSRYGAPVLMTVKKQGKECVLDTLEKYEEEDSASPEVLRRVANRVRSLYPASSYGLILGSHGSGWVPVDVWFARSRSAVRKAENAPLTRSFGEDFNRGKELYGKGGMEVSDLADALPEGYHFILFDVCLMANAEMVYALRNKTDYIIASPAEVLVDGFPYQKVMPLLWGGEQQLREACQEFRNYYENYPRGGSWQSGLVALIKTQHLDALAAQVKDILDGKKQEIAALSPSDVWRYPLIDYTQDVFFDLGEFMHKMASESQYIQFKAVLDAAVCRFSTTRFNDIAVPVDKYSGLSVYIPLSKWNAVNSLYFDLEWSRYVYDK